MTTLPPNYLRLSSKWLETNPLPEDGLLLEADDTWKPSSQRGRITATPGFDYATARTDLPREAYADSEPGAEVASERAEETETTPCLICGKPVEGYVAEYCCSGHECGCMGAPMEPCTCSKECDAALFENIGMPMEERRIKAGIAKWDELATLRAQLDAKEAECQRLQKDNKWLRDTLTNREKTLSNVNSEVASARTERDKLLAECRELRELSERRAETIAVAMHNQKVADQDHASTVSSIRSENDKLRAEVEHRAKQRDEFQNLFIEASDGFNQRGEQLARIAAELDAVRKERDQFQERCSSEWAVAVERDAAQARCGALERAVAQARNWEFLDNHKEGCQIFGLHPKPCSCGKEQRIAYLDQFLAPSQQPDNLDSSGGESRTAIAGADGSKHTEGDCNPQGSESRKANPKIASESSASPAVNPSRPEPVKAGEWLPMETAPKRKVLLRIKTSPDAFRKVEALWINGQWDFDGMLFFKPVGWKPIAPEGKATEGEG